MKSIRMIITFILACILSWHKTYASDWRTSSTIYGERRNPDGSRRDNRGTDASEVFRGGERSDRQRIKDRAGEVSDRVDYYNKLASGTAGSLNPALRNQVNSLKEGVEQLRRLVEKRNKVRGEIADLDHHEVRQELVDIATDSLRTARDYYRNDELEEGQIAATIADIALNMATSFTPGVSWGRDIYEALSGKSLINGAELDGLARSMAIVGAVTAGFGSKIGKALGVLGRLMKGHDASSTLRSAERLIESARGLTKSSPARHGHLHSIPMGTGTLADTFRSSTYFTYQSTSPITLYRVQSKPFQAGDRLGRFWTRDKPAGPVQAIIDSALDPTWGNSGTHWIRIEVPTGKTLHEGIAAAQRGLVGGGNQVLLEEIAETWIKEQGKF